jgi:hypothetical protein
MTNITANQIQPVGYVLENPSHCVFFCGGEHVDVAACLLGCMKNFSADGGVKRSARLVFFPQPVDHPPQPPSPLLLPTLPIIN